MKLISSITLTTLLSAIAILVFSYFLWYKPKFKLQPDSHLSAIKKSSDRFEKLQLKANSLLQFAKKKRYNEEIFFLIDMSIPSGRNRFFVYNVPKDSIMLEGLVAHGSCDNGFQPEPTFSNTINSGCSCIGKFKIGNKYAGRFGTAYKLHGLDSSNNNAFTRTIVLHSYECVPEQETYPVPICNSRGCPMVSPGFLEQLKPIIQKSPEPLLLWIYE